MKQVLLLSSSYFIDKKTKQREVKQNSHSQFLSGKATIWTEVDGVLSTALYFLCKRKLNWWKSINKKYISIENYLSLQIKIVTSQNWWKQTHT